MAVQLQQWYSDVRLHAPNAPDPLIDEALIFAAEVFCTRSGIVQQFLRADATAGQAQVTFTPPANTVIRRFVKVWYHESEIFSAGPSLVDIPTPYYAPPPGTPVRYLDQAGNVVRVYPAPADSETNAFSAVAVLAPTHTAKELPDILWNEWRYSIAAGARAYVKSVPGQPWTGDASGDAAMFARAINDATWIAEVGNVRGELRATSPIRFGFFANDR